MQHYPPERVSEITGVPVAQIREAAELYALTPKAGIFYTLGITEHTTGTANVMNLANLAMVTGHIGVENAGVNPLRGQNNVQGSCDMGALPNSLPGYPSVNDEAARARFSAAYGVTMPEKMGLRIPEMLDMAVYGKLKAMFVMGEDPALTDADANHVRKALDSLEFLVAQNLFMTETAKYADVFLPAACYARRTAPSPTPSAACSACARPSSRPASAGPTGRSSPTSPCAWATRCTTTRPRRSSTRCARWCHSYAGISYERIDKVRAAVALPRQRAPGHAVPARRPALRAARACCRASSTSRRPSSCNDEYPILLTTGRMLYHYNIMTRHSANLETLRPARARRGQPGSTPSDSGFAEGDTRAWSRGAARSPRA